MTAFFAWGRPEMSHAGRPLVQSRRLTRVLIVRVAEQLVLPNAFLNGAGDV